MFHKVKAVNALPDFLLSVQFAEGVTKLYDVKPLFDKWTVFQWLQQHPECFHDVSVSVGGYGIKAISKMFNEEGVPSPGALKQRLYAKPGREKPPKPDAPKSVKLSLWENTAVKRILQNEFYCGTLVCHKTYVSKINHIKKEIPPEEQYRHENAVPAIVSREIWEQAQLLLSEKPKRNVRASAGKPCHRYAGLIKWGDKPER